MRASSVDDDNCGAVEDSTSDLSSKPPSELESFLDGVICGKLLSLLLPPKIRESEQQELEYAQLW